VYGHKKIIFSFSGGWKKSIAEKKGAPYNQMKWNHISIFARVLCKETCGWIHIDKGEEFVHLTCLIRSSSTSSTDFSRFSKEPIFLIKKIRTSLLCFWNLPNNQGDRYAECSLRKAWQTRLNKWMTYKRFRWIHQGTLVIFSVWHSGECARYSKIYSPFTLCT